MRWLAIGAVLAGCNEPKGDDVVGPFTGLKQRYVVSTITLPLNNTDARLMADDLDGDERVDNMLGMALGALSSNGNLTLYGRDMIGAGAIASYVELQSNSSPNDDTVSVTYFGAEGEPAVLVGGVLEDGWFRSNRTRTTTVPGRAVLHLPVFADADPSVVVLEGLQIDLIPGGPTHSHGYDAMIRGGVGTDVVDQTVKGLIEMVAANPAGHPYVMILFDTNKDGVISDEEVRTNDFIESLLRPDVTLRIASGGTAELMSFGFVAHLSRCETDCVSAPENLCFDRVVDGDESDVDCGGSCMACAGDKACRGPSDCQSQSCNAGVCAAPSCSDGVKSGLESDVDCGWNCAKCAAGQLCERDSDCASGDCGLTRCN